MPREARLDFPGALHHVMARGIERRQIFWDDDDREAFLDRLADALQRFATPCYAWALMPNHFHLLLATGKRPVHKVLHSVLFRYASYFNRTHRRSGHLFQNRYKRILGGGEFVGEALKAAEEALDRRLAARRKGWTPERVLAKAAREAGVDVKEVVAGSRRRPANRARALAAYWIVEELGRTGVEAARLLRVSQPSVSLAVARLRADARIPRLGENL